MLDLSKETEDLARRLALAKHAAIDDVIRAALEEKARSEGVALDAPRPRDNSPEARAARIARFEEIANAVAALPILDPRSVQEIVDDLNAL